MGFIFGLLIGSAISSGGSVPPILGSIPFRCLAAFDVSEHEYRNCRGRSLNKELYDGGGCDSGQRSDFNHQSCSFERNITWEIAGLREMKRAMEQKQATAR